MEVFINALAEAARSTAVSLSHNWPYLLVSVAVAGALKAFVDREKVSVALRRFGGAGVLAATGAAVATPFCSCGTTAVVLGMMASTMPMAPIVAFMVASPLSSPSELFYGAGLFGWPFAIAHFAASIFLGLAGGAIATILERRGLLADQARLSGGTKAGSGRGGSSAARQRPSFRETKGLAAAPLAPAASCSCSPVPAPVAPPPASCGCVASPAGGASGRGLAAPAESAPGSMEKLSADVRKLASASLEVARRLIPMFLGFAFIGFTLNGLIPASWVQALFGAGKAYSVPLAATVGLPLYLSSEASLPLVRALLDSGMSQGAIMAFLISGAGTSVGAITGALTIARWKVVGLVVATLWIGAMAAGWAFDLLLATGLL